MTWVPGGCKRIFPGAPSPAMAASCCCARWTRNLGLTQSLAQCFGDQRQQVFVDHSVRQLLTQRIYGLALGYEDLNDHDATAARSAAGDGLRETGSPGSGPLQSEPSGFGPGRTVHAQPDGVVQQLGHPLPQAAARSGQDRSLSVANGGALPAQTRQGDRD
jgi:hypothetical protein